MKINYIHEPTDLQCGQAVLAMLIGTSAEAICQIIGNDRETNLREMKDTLRNFGFTVSDARVPVKCKHELPPLCMLSLETPRCWHWSLYCDGTFYDPEHGYGGFSRIKPPILLESYTSKKSEENCLANGQQKR